MLSASIQKDFISNHEKRFDDFSLVEGGISFFIAFFFNFKDHNIRLFSVYVLHLLFVEFIFINNKVCVYFAEDED